MVTFLTSETKAFGLNSQSSCSPTPRTRSDISLLNETPETNVFRPAIIWKEFAEPFCDSEMFFVVSRNTFSTRC